MAMKFRLNMISKRSGMDGHYERCFKHVDWPIGKIFDLPPEIVLGEGRKNTTNISSKGENLLVYTEDLVPVEFKPLKDWM